MMQAKKAGRLVNTAARRLKAAGLLVSGVALVSDNPPKAATSYYPLPTTLLKAGDESFLRIDWQGEPSLADIAKAVAVLRVIDYIKLLGDRTELTPTEVYAQMQTLSGSQQQALLLQVTARLLKNYPDVAATFNVNLDKPA